MSQTVDQPQYKSWKGIPNIAVAKLPARFLDDPRLARKKAAIIAKQALLERVKLNKDPETAIVDLVADLRHLCDVLGIEWHDVRLQAASHYEAEVVGDW